MRTCICIYCAVQNETQSRSKNPKIQSNGARLVSSTNNLSGSP